MRPSRFNEEQIIAILREQEAGAATAEVAAGTASAAPRFISGRPKYGGSDVSDARRLKTLDDENRR